MSFGKTWERNYLNLELGLAIIITSATWITFDYLQWAHLDSLLSGQRSNLYGVLASIFGALLGFSITTMSIVGGIVSGDRFKPLQNSRYYPMIWRTFMSANRALALALAVAIVGLLADRDSDPVWSLTMIFWFSILLAIFRVSRCIWILERVVAIQNQR